MNNDPLLHHGRLKNCPRRGGIRLLRALPQTAIFFGLLFLTAACAPRNPRAPVRLAFADTVAMPDLDALERQIHARVNQVRRSHRLPELAWDGELTGIARQYSLALRRAGYLSHNLGRSTLAKRYDKANYECRIPLPGGSRMLTGGENLALTPQIPQIRRTSGQPDQPVSVRNLDAIVKVTVDGWLNSPPHRKNLLLPHWKKQGIGVVIDSNHRLWITQNFC